MPTATRVAGFWAWKNLGRSVNAGAKGIRILAPIVGVRRKKDKEAEKDITKQNERVLLGLLTRRRKAGSPGGPAQKEPHCDRGLTEIAAPFPNR